MKCPFDDTQLRCVEKNGIEIEWCETCKGVWLERGELDKIIDRVSEDMSRPAPQPEWSDRPREQKYDRDDRDDRRPDQRYDNRDYKKKKKSSLLSEMFEF